VRDKGLRGQVNSLIPPCLSATSSLRASVPSCFPPAFFNCCIPLSFIPDNSELGNLPGPTA